MLHHYTVHFIASELFFEADNVGAVPAPSLELDFAGDRRLMTLVIVTERYNFDGKFLGGRTMLGQHDLTESAIAKLLY